MRVLFVVNTPYQLMAAIRIIDTELNNVNVDLCIGDTIADVNSLYERIKNIGLFDNISIIEKKKYSNKKNLFGFVFDYLTLNWCNKKGVFQQYIYENRYDDIYIANIDKINKLLYKVISRENKQIRVHLYEDGFATYSNAYGSYFGNLYSAKNKIKSIFTFNNIYYKIVSMRVFTPELVVWKPKFNIVSIKKIGRDDLNYLNIMNSIFNFNTLEDSYTEDFIFFEESYYADGVDMGDVSVVNNLTQIVGKNNIFIKIHPRNKVNRFKELGYKTNNDTSVPWEIIAMNIEMSDKVLITIASGSALTSLVNMSTKPRSIIMLMNCDGIEKEKLTPSRPILERVAEINSGVVFLPQNRDELEKYLRDSNT